MLSLTLNYLLNINKISKNKICKDLNISRTNLNRYCNNECKRWDIDVISRIMEYLDVSLPDLVNYHNTAYKTYPIIPDRIDAMDFIKFQIGGVEMDIDAIKNRADQYYSFQIERLKKMDESDDSYEELNSFVNYLDELTSQLYYIDDLLFDAQNTIYKWYDEIGYKE